LLVLNEPYIIMNEAQRDVANKDEYISGLVNKHSKTRLLRCVTAAALTELDDDLDDVFLDGGVQFAGESQKDTESRKESLHSSSVESSQEVNTSEIIEQENAIVPEEVENVDENTASDALQLLANKKNIETDTSHTDNSEILKQVDEETWSSSEDSDINSQKNEKDLPEETAEKNTEISFTV